MKIPWLLYCLAFAALCYGIRQLVVAVVIWKTHRQKPLLPVTPLLAPDLTPHYDFKEPRRCA